MAQPPPRRNNAMRKTDDDRLLPAEEFTFTWDDVVGYDARKRLVTVRIVKTKSKKDDDDEEEEKLSVVDMESFHHSSALSHIMDYLADQLQEESITRENVTLIEAWMADLEIAVEHLRGEEEELRKSLTPDKFGFCCGVCKCPPSRKSDFVVTSGDDMLFHRYCCHNIVWCKNTWKSPADVASMDLTDRMLEGIESTLKHPPDYAVCDMKLLRKKLKAAAGADTKKNNDTEDAHPSSTWHTNPIHQEFAIKFQNLRNAIDNGVRPKQDGAVVVDLFSGIGTFLVGLKQAGIKIKKVIHVDHDMVACHVSKCRHEDDIEHFYVDKFEDISGTNLDDFLAAVHDPIDIIVGGPPCQDFTSINAFREGVEGMHGKYLLMTGEFILNIQRRQRDHHLWYLIENVYLRGDDLDLVCKAFGGATPMQVDSYHFSPCNRNRHYFLNFPVSVEFNDQLDLQARCDDILEDGFVLPQTKASFANRHTSWSKANTLMASKSRMDDDRMLVVKPLEGSKEKQEYELRTFTVTERERMMGLPDGYVGGPVNSLFEVLKPVALMQANRIKQNEENPEIQEIESWKTLLSEEYHCFAGEKYRFKVSDRSLYVELKMAPPVNGSKYPTEFFTDEEYAKHLIGNSVSVSVVEMLLTPLKDLFEQGEYIGYPYKYSWLFPADELLAAPAPAVVPSKVPGPMDDRVEEASVELDDAPMHEDEDDEVGDKPAQEDATDEEIEWGDDATGRGRLAERAVRKRSRLDGNRERRVNHVNRTTAKRYRSDDEDSEDSDDATPHREYEDEDDVDPDKDAHEDDANEDNDDDDNDVNDEVGGHGDHGGAAAVTVAAPDKVDRVRPEDDESFLPINPENVFPQIPWKDQPPRAPQAYKKFQEKYRPIIWL